MNTELSITSTDLLKTNHSSGRFGNRLTTRDTIFLQTAQLSKKDHSMLDRTNMDTFYISKKTKQQIL